MALTRQWFVYGLYSVGFLGFLPGFARAAEQPTPFSFDAGPLGTLELSGGADGFAYALTGTGDEWQ